MSKQHGPREPVHTWLNSLILFCGPVSSYICITGSNSDLSIVSHILISGRLGAQKDQGLLRHRYNIQWNNFF